MMLASPMAAPRVKIPPGIREGDMGKMYLAYLRDPAGNKICALKRL
jgi:hypothetical protein